MPTDRKARFQRSARHTYRMELVLEFSGPVTASHGRETARRILDGLHLATEPTTVDAELQEAQIFCHTMGRILPLRLPEEPMPHLD